MNYSKRVLEIIEILIEQTDYISVSAIATQMAISKRTIFREMEDVEKLLDTFDVILHKKTKLGIKIEANKEQIENIKTFTKKNKGAHYSQEERSNLIKVELLKSREPKKFYHFSNLLSVSEATISYDMDKVEPWFEARGITLIRKPGYGVYLSGKEGAFRKAIVDFLYENYEHQDLIALLDNREAFVETIMDREIIVKINTILSAYENILAHRMTDNAFMGLMLHLSIAVSRILRGERIVMNKEVLSRLKNDAQYEVAREIGADIEQTFHIKFPEDELGFITMHLKGSKLKTGSLIDEEDLVLSNFELSRLALNMILQFKVLSDYDLKEDEKLLIGLVSHLRPALTRMNLSLDIRNPLLSKIMEMYPEIFEMSRQVSTQITKHYGFQVPDEEVGYIAMHFGAAIERYIKLQSIDKRIRTGVVCSSGIGTSSLLYSRLLKLFPRLEIIGQFSKEDVRSGAIDAHELELLITTINISHKELPSIHVNPLLMEEDIERIKQVISILSSRVKPYLKKKEQASDDVQKQSVDIRRIHAITDAVLTIEEGFKLYDMVKVKNINDLIGQISEKLTPEKVLRKKLIQTFIEREKLGSTLLRGEGILLLHIKSEAVKQLIYQIWRPIKPINHASGEKIRAAVVMLIPQNSVEAQLEVMSQLSKAMIEEDTFTRLIKVGTEASLTVKVKEILHNWLSKQMQGGHAYEK